MTGGSAMPSLRLLTVGVGGQGVLTFARLLGEAALRAGLEVRLGQLHGMSQRGGSVESTVLLGPGHSTFVEAGQADFVVALEPLEALRARPRMAARCQVLVSLGRIVPYRLAMQGKPYPPLDDLLAAVRAASESVMPIDGPALAERAGSARSLNMVMLGALSAVPSLPLPSTAIRDAIATATAASAAGANLRAFELGQRAAAAHRAPAEQ